MTLSKQLEQSRKHYIDSQNKVKAITNNIIPELTKNLESKIKETEMLKEMLRSSKIEIGGKEREIKRLKAKLAGGLQLLAGGVQVKTKIKQRPIDSDSKKSPGKYNSLAKVQNIS